MKEPWYADGLRFSCTQCGHCCTGEPGYVWVTPGEIRRLAAFLKLSTEEFGKRHLRSVAGRHLLLEKANGDCILYDKGCTVYPSRPIQCRTFPFWSENLVSRAAWEKAAEGCPGAGRGKLYSVEEIRIIRRGKADAARR